VFLVVGIVAVLGATAFLLYQSGQFKRWFASDTDNVVELKRLREEPPTIPPPAVSEAGWPQWLGPLRDGRAPAGPLRTDWDTNPPKEHWSTPLGGGYSSTAVVGGRVYTQDREGGNERVVCLDAATGKIVWTHAYSASQPGRDRTYASGPRATPTVEGNRVYTVGGAGKLLCLEAPPTAKEATVACEHPRRPRPWRWCRSA
jgi:outer membrane protein assembly factor BamB